jgi:hypothetical protein
MPVVYPCQMMKVGMLEEIMAVECIHPGIEAKESQERNGSDLDTIEGDEIENLIEQTNAPIVTAVLRGKKPDYAGCIDERIDFEMHPEAQQEAGQDSMSVEHCPHKSNHHDA